MIRSVFAFAALVALAALAAFVTLGTDASARHRTAAAPVPTPTPRLVVAGEGGALNFGEPGDLHGLAGYISSIVRGGVRFAYCRVPGGEALADLARGTPASACGADAGKPAFAVTGLPADAAAVAAFAANGDAGGGELVQVPYVAHAVAIVYDNPDVRGRLRLSVDALCRIASGAVDDWNRIPLDPANAAGLHYPHRPLRFVYRTDPNGETFSLANFLSATDASGARSACPRPGDTFALAAVFDPANTTAVPAPPFGVLPVPLPAGASRRPFLGASGDDGELACVRGRRGACRGAGGPGGPGTIGYAAVADVTGTTTTATGVARLYVVENGIPHEYDPIADLPGVSTQIETDVRDRVLAPFVRNGRPRRELVPADRPPKTARCLAAIAPSAYAFPAVGYPIVAVTNLAFAATGNGERTIALRTLAGLANESKNFTSKRIRSIDGDGVSTGTAGVSVLPLSTKKRGVPELIRCIRP